MGIGLREQNAGKSGHGQARGTIWHEVAKIKKKQRKMVKIEKGVVRPRLKIATVIFL